ncbi:MAG: HAD family hydrolase [Ruminococcaceae bacterium]|nr:HAD family hydrolase [Oscillospiraceae bacterium]
MKKLVIFDLDGTLLDTLGDLCDAVNFAVESVGRPKRTMGEVRTFIGNGTKKMLQRALGDCFDDGLLGECISKYTEYYSKNYAVRTYVYEGINECLEKLVSNGIECAVVTNKLHDISVDLCDRFFPGKFSRVIGDYNGAARKPDPSKTLDVIREVSCDVAVFVGDSHVDVETAKNAGIPCVALTWGYDSKEALETAGAKIFADDARQLYNRLAELLNIAK